MFAYFLESHGVRMAILNDILSWIVSNWYSKCYEVNLSGITTFYKWFIVLSAKKNEILYSICRKNPSIALFFILLQYAAESRNSVELLPPANCTVCPHPVQTMLVNANNRLNVLSTWKLKELQSFPRTKQFNLVEFFCRNAWNSVDFVKYCKLLDSKIISNNLKIYLKVSRNIRVFLLKLDRKLLWNKKWKYERKRKLLKNRKTIC